MDRFTLARNFTTKSLSQKLRGQLLRHFCAGLYSQNWHKPWLNGAKTHAVLPPDGLPRTGLSFLTEYSKFNYGGIIEFLSYRSTRHGFCKTTFPPILLMLLLSKLKWKFYRNQLLTEMAQNLGKWCNFVCQTYSKRQ